MILFRSFFVALEHHIEATSALEGDRKLCRNGVSAVF